MKRTVQMLAALAALAALLAGCAAPASGGSAASQTPEGSASLPDASSEPEGDASSQTEDPESAQTGSQASIPFSGDQFYAAAYAGYEGNLDLDYYKERYLDGQEVPVHYFSPWEYYLIIPRYPDMSLALYRNDIQSDQPTLVYEDPVCEPFLIQCNISDIFSDVTVELTWQGETVSFSPYISLKDGSVQIGERGLNLTRDASA